MRKNLQVIGVALIVLMLASCGGSKSKEVKLIPVKSGKDFQYIDQEGKIVINPQFNQATVFRNGLALVQTNGENPKWGFIGEDGKFVIPATYKSATVFSEDLAWVVTEGSAPTAINNKGEIKITLPDAQSVCIFKGGLAAFSVADTSGVKWGFVDNTGKVKITPQFTAVGSFNESLCAVANKDGKWGYIDKDGKIVINNQFDRANEFINGKAVVTTEDKTGVIDTKGKYTINPQFHAMIADGDLFVIEQDHKWGWCDKDGKITINPQFTEALPFGDKELAPVQSGENYGFIDKEGKIAINPQFQGALPFNGKLALVMSNKKIGFIDKDGKYVINPQFDDVSRDFMMYLINGSSEFEVVFTDYKAPIDTTKQVSTGQAITASVSSSSYLNPSSGLTYSPQNVADNVLTTWWSPKTQSTQEWIKINFGSVINIEGIEIHAGSHYPNFQTLGNLYPLNSRITQATLEFSDGSTENVTFADIDEIQRFGFPVRQTSFIKLYPKTWQTGNKWKDLCISHFAGIETAK